MNRTAAARGRVRRRLSALIATGCFIVAGRSALWAQAPELQAFSSARAVQFLRETGQVPHKYVAGKFADHSIVLLGEAHWVRHDEDLVIDLIRQHGGRTFDVLASEFYLASLQEEIDALIRTPEWNPVRGAAILRADGWPYAEYLEILHAVWEVNRDRPGALRVVALNPGSDWRATLLPRGATYDSYMAERLLESASGDSVRVLGHMGFHHAFTRYYQPDSWRDGRVRRFMERAGNIVWRARGERVFMIALHPPFLCRQGDAFGGCLPLGGVIDCAAVVDRTPVGFDVFASPFARLRVRAHYALGYQDLRFADLADGYVWQRPPDAYEGVGLIPLELFAPDSTAVAQVLANNPFTDEPDVTAGDLARLWAEETAALADLPQYIRWLDAARWRGQCDRR